MTIKCLLLLRAWFIIESLRSTTRPAERRGLNFSSRMSAKFQLMLEYLSNNITNCDVRAKITKAMAMFAVISTLSSMHGDLLGRNKPSLCFKDVIMVSLTLCSAWQTVENIPLGPQIIHSSVLHDKFLSFTSASLSRPRRRS